MKNKLLTILDLQMAVSNEVGKFISRDKIRRWMDAGMFSCSRDRNDMRYLTPEEFEHAKKIIYLLELGADPDAVKRRNHFVIGIELDRIKMMIEKVLPEYAQK